MTRLSEYERGRQVGRREGLEEAANLIGERAARMRGDENALVFATNARVGIAALAGPAQVTLTGEEEVLDPIAYRRLRQQVEMVWEARLVAHGRWCEAVGKTHPEPKRTAEADEAIRKCIERHGYELARDAGIGIYYSKWHTGEDPKTEGRKYLEAPRPWLKPRGKLDPAPGFAELARAAREEAR